LIRIGIPHMRLAKRANDDSSRYFQPAAKDRWRQGQTQRETAQERVPKRERETERQRDRGTER
jgi:hypothetical protein